MPEHVERRPHRDPIGPHLDRLKAASQIPTLYEGNVPHLTHLYDDQIRKVEAMSEGHLLR